MQIIELGHLFNNQNGTVIVVNGPIKHWGPAVLGPEHGHEALATSRKLALMWLLSLAKNLVKMFFQYKVGFSVKHVFKKKCLYYLLWKFLIFCWQKEFPKTKLFWHNLPTKYPYLDRPLEYLLCAVVSFTDYKARKDHWDNPMSFITQTTG